jgi:RNA polymerase sigma factor (sigma-70 family)
MPAGRLQYVIHHLRQAERRREAAARGDGQLLEAFLARREEAAFEALVRRHGPMVLGVCRRVLRHEHDAEDAFQATFLVLARKAASVRPREMVGPWLYGVACRTAMKARTENAARRMRERQVCEMPQPQLSRDADDGELFPLLDQELNRLPERYWVPVVLCDLEGRSRREAAARLGCPEGTLSSRLARARELLARRMKRHGVVVGAGAIAASLTADASAAVPAALLTSTVRAAALVAAGKSAAGVASAGAAHLAKGVIKAMLLTKLKIVTAVLIVVGAIGFGAGTYGRYAKAQDRGTAVNPALTAPALPPPPKPKKEDKDLIQGTWQVVEAEAGGKHQLWEETTKQSWTITDTKITIRCEEPEEKELVEFSYQLGDLRNPENKPREIDMKHLNGHWNGTPSAGIYELSGDRLRVSYHRNGERPADFEDKGEDRGRRYYVLKRVKPDKEEDKPKSEKDSDFTWGNTVNDLQAGIAVRPAGKTTYRIGETVQLVVKVRNVGKDARDFSFPSAEPFDGVSPIVFDAAGKRRTVAMPPTEFYFPRYSTMTLKAGEEFELGAPTLALTVAVEDGKVKQPTLAGAPGKVKISYRYDPWNILLAAGRENEILSTGSMELEIKDTTKAETKKDADMAWGETVGGLQLGIGSGPDAKHTARIGDKVEFVVKVRNVSDKPATYTYTSEPFKDHAPTVEDADGKKVKVDMPIVERFRTVRIEVTVKPGEVLDFDKEKWGGSTLALRPVDDTPLMVREPTLRARPGTYKISYQSLAELQSNDDKARRLSTGSLTLEVKEAGSGEKPGPKADSGFLRFNRAAISFLLDKKEGAPDKLTVTDAEAMKTLAAFFPGLGQGKKSSTAAGWKAALLIDFHSTINDDEKVVRVTVNRDYDTWSEGNGDWTAKPGLEKFVAGLIDKAREKRTRPLLKEYRGTEEIPDALYQTYAYLVEAMTTGEKDEIKKLSLQGSIQVTEEGGTDEYSRSVNEVRLPFARKSFQKQIQGIQPGADGTCSIRTNTSTLFFVETKSSGWKLYRYYDKPIE